MKRSSYNYRECFETSPGCYVFFGKKGYITVVDNSIVAHIEASCYRLATQDFTDKLPGTQEIPVTQLGLAGMLAYLEVHPNAMDQRRLKTYKKHNQVSSVVSSNH